MNILINGYSFTVEENNANNILLEKVDDSENIIDDIKQFII